MTDADSGTLRVSDQETVFTLSRQYRLPLRRRGITLLVFTAAAAAFGANVVVFRPAAVFFGLCTAWCAAVYVWQRRFATVLTPDGIAIRGYFSHFVPWTEVTGFAVHSEFGGQRLLSGDAGMTVYRGSSRGMMPQRSGGTRRRSTVHVVRRHGRRLLLRAPVVTSWQADPGFGDKTRLLEQWLSLHGNPPPAARGVSS